MHILVVELLWFYVEGLQKWPPCWNLKFFFVNLAFEMTFNLRFCASCSKHSHSIRSRIKGKPKKTQQRVWTAWLSVIRGNDHDHRDGSISIKLKTRNFPGRGCWRNWNACVGRCEVKTGRSSRAIRIWNGSGVVWKSHSKRFRASSALLLLLLGNNAVCV